MNIDGEITYDNATVHFPGDKIKLNIISSIQIILNNN